MSLIELAERCEKVSGPAFVLDREISDAMGHGDELVRPYSASLDAAMTLVPEGCLWHVTNTSVEEHFADLSRATALVGYPDETRDNTVEAATPALALVAAALRARAQQEQTI